jgi:hypothetical protein
MIDRLLESENLTDNLDDESANILIRWGIGQIDHLIEGKDEEAAGTAINHLMGLMRAVNSIAGNPVTVSTDSLVKLTDRLTPTFDKEYQLTENERTIVAQQISRMQPIDAVDYLLKWLESKL